MSAPIKVDFRSVMDNNTVKKPDAVSAIVNGGGDGVKLPDVPTLGAQPNPPHLQLFSQRLAVVSFFNSGRHGIISFKVHRVFGGENAEEEAHRFIIKELRPLEQRVAIDVISIGDWHTAQVASYAQQSDFERGRTRIYTDPNLQKIMSRRVEERQRDERELLEQALSIKKKTEKTRRRMEQDYRERVEAQQAEYLRKQKEEKKKLESVTSSAVGGSSSSSTSSPVSSVSISELDSESDNGVTSTTTAEAVVSSSSLEK